VPGFVVLSGCSGNVPPPSFALAEPKLDFQALAFRLLSRYAEHSSALSVRCGLVPLSQSAAAYSALLLAYSFFFVALSLFLRWMRRKSLLQCRWFGVSACFQLPMFVEGLLHTHWYRWLVRVSGCFSLPLVIKTFRYSFFWRRKICFGRFAARRLSFNLFRCLQS
jgi:hypothetical protein